MPSWVNRERLMEQGVAQPEFALHRLLKKIEDRGYAWELSSPEVYGFFPGMYEVCIYEEASAKPAEKRRDRCCIVARADTPENATALALLEIINGVNGGDEGDEGDGGDEGDEGDGGDAAGEDNRPTEKTHLGRGGGHGASAALAARPHNRRRPC